MNTRKFLETVWPPSGPYCIATPWVTNDGKEVMAHRGCDTIDDAITYIALKKQSKDLYFATHVLKVVRELNPKTGRLQTFRTTENMRESRDFFFDFDVGPNKTTGEIYYATQQDVLNTLEKFLFETSLPSPFVINSGYGIHVHWIVNTPLESMAWTEPATKLKALAEKHELHVDPSKVDNPTIVLRVPNTFNYKDPANPRKVTILAHGVVTPTKEFLDQLDQLTSAYAPMGHKPGKRAYKSKNLSTAWDGRWPDADEVAHVCEHMRTFRDSKGNISEPLWHVGIGTLKHCDEGQAKAQEWSSGYPEYTEAETQAKLDAWTKPPPGCDKISKNSGDPSICARCPHRDLAKNPILIANKVYEQTHQPAPTAVSHNVTPPCEPPTGYTLDEVWGIKQKGEGVICDYLMFPVEYIKATLNENCLSRWSMKHPRDGWKTVEILDEALKEPKSLAAAFRGYAFVLHPYQYKPTYIFMHAYLQSLIKSQDTFSQYDYVGWEKIALGPSEVELPAESETPKYFILHGRKISVANGSRIPCRMTQNTQLYGMGQLGSLAKQIEIMKFYNAPEYKAQQFAIAAALATPYFKYSGLHGMLICLTGDTGASKSTGAYFAASLWGHPEDYCISGLRSGATDLGRQERGAILRNLPFIVDEITRFEDQVAHEIALAASQPGARVTLKPDRSIRHGRGGEKYNLTICTSNRSLVQMVNSDSSGGQAGIMRVFEIKVNRNTARSKIEADNALRELKKNYGWIGEDSLRRCLPRIDELSEKYIELLQKFEADINGSPEERFMIAAAVTALFGIWLGNWLGYFQFSYQEMRDWLINEQIPAMREAARREREQSAPETILNEYLETINPNTCRIGKNSRGDIEVIYAPPTVEFKARYETFNEKVYVRLGSFREYCTNYHHDYNDVLDKLLASGFIALKRIKKRMRSEKGTCSVPVPCFVIQMKASSPIAVPSAPPEDNLKIVDFTKKPKP